MDRSRFGRERRDVLCQYITADVLGCESEASSDCVDPDKDLLSSLIRCEDGMVRESSVRLINTIATDSNGRTVC